MRTRVLIVGDDRLSSVGLAALLSEQDSVEVVGQVTGDVAYSAATGSLDPQVLLWETGIDPLGSLETIADVCESAIWLDKGHIKEIGPAEDVVAAYRGSV